MRGRPYWLLLVVGLSGFAAWRVAARGWLCDDSFIFLRYAQNLVSGEGLVYNPGERVEGYTSLLRTLGLAGLVSVDVAPEAAALVLGRLPMSCSSDCCSAGGSRTATKAPSSPWGPRSSSRSTTSTSGRQAASRLRRFTALALGGLLLARARHPSPRSDLAAGGVLGLTVLARPDGALFALAGLSCPWWAPEPASARARARRTLLMLSPAAVLVSLQLAFKLSYYGELLPTAFYSKSALVPYYSQGLLYVGLWLAKNWVVLPAALAAPFWGWGRTDAARSRAEAAFFAASGLAFTAYVAHSGGDFMFARRLVPALPLLLLWLEHAVARLAPGGQRVLTTAVLAGALLPFPLYGPARARIAGIADEPSFYPPETIALRRQQAS